MKKIIVGFLLSLFVLPGVASAKADMRLWCEALAENHVYMIDTIKRTSVDRVGQNNLNDPTFMRQAYDRMADVIVERLMKRDPSMGEILMISRRIMDDTKEDWVKYAKTYLVVDEASVRKNAYSLCMKHY